MIHMYQSNVLLTIFDNYIVSLGVIIATSTTAAYMYSDKGSDTN